MDFIRKFDNKTYYMIRKWARDEEEKKLEKKAPRILK